VGVSGLERGSSDGGSGAAGRERDRRKKAGGRRPVAGNRTVKNEPNFIAGAGGEADHDVQHRPSPIQSRSSSRGRPARSTYPFAVGGGVGKVHPRRQGSHDDIGLSRSQGSYDGDGVDGEQGDGPAAGKGGLGESGVSAEEEMMRRMWESREVYDKGVAG
jgi:hypothetical protein